MKEIKPGVSAKRATPGSFFPVGAQPERCARKFLTDLQRAPRCKTSRKACRGCAQYPSTLLPSESDRLSCIAACITSRRSYVREASTRYTLRVLRDASIVFDGRSRGPPKTATIRGIVRDDSSRRTPIPGAQVTLTRMDQNDMKVVVSNRRAKYSVETPAGTYESRGELPGFEGFENTTCPTQRTP